MYKVIEGDCLRVLETLEEDSVDCIVTDPPYLLGFMGKEWDDSGVSFQADTWAKCLRVLKPGGYLLAFGGSRTFHRIACAIEDAGFEMRDTIMWLYGSGFPKSMNIGLAIDKKLGIESEDTGAVSPNARPNSTKANTLFKSGTVGKNFTIKKACNEWDGWGTCLKPSFEPIIIARKPFKGSLVDNVLKYGVGGLNIDECRVGTEEIKVGTTPDFRDVGKKSKEAVGVDKLSFGQVRNAKRVPLESHFGRFPANTILTYDEGDFDEVCGGLPTTKSITAKGIKRQRRGAGVFDGENNGFQNREYDPERAEGYDDSGSAARYFYCAKASKKDRDEGMGEFEEKTSGQMTGRKEGSAGITPRTGPRAPKRNNHPTVKPTNLMQYLIRLVAPKGATILDPFMGSGSTGKAVAYENRERNAGYKFIGIDREHEYCDIAEARISYIAGKANVKREKL